ncbi:Peroxidase [Penicillium daleae]|uniref:Peroxidase n=1 Tax=Penicillium daleae TaxID=63821 RepID=A0AAD6C0L2_9EURO|nr:Peroxidase [Penicillium daleae]KAJ5443567.1 Peroxidase [Penicillium daleae]
MPKKEFPNFRFYDTFWMTELDFQAHGQNLLWRIVTENSEVKCLQRNPLFPMDPITNPMLCTLPSQGVDYKVLASTGVEVTLTLIRQHWVQLLMAFVALAAGSIVFKKTKKRDPSYPPVLQGRPIFGRAVDFKNDSKKLLLEGFQKYGSSRSKAFGIPLASLTHYVLSQPEDLEMMLDDNPYELKFSLRKFFEAINVPIILRKQNFASNINPLVPAGSASKAYENLSDYMDHYITSVSARCMVGADAYTHPELIDMFLKFNVDVDKTMGLASMLPSFLNFIANIPISQSYDKFRDILIPIIKKRRPAPTHGQDGLMDFMPFILKVIDDDTRASDVIAIIVWIGLRNLQISVTSTLLDIINVPGLAIKVASSLSGASVANLDTFGLDATKGTPGPSSAAVATLSSFYSHRLPVNYGADAENYQAERFVEHDPDIGSTRFITWGLKGPHACPGRWFTQEAICIMVKALLEEYEFSPESIIADEEKYIYHAGVVTRKEVPIVVRRTTP